VLALAEDILETQVERYAGKEMDLEDWDLPALTLEIARVFGLETDAVDALDLDAIDTEAIVDTVWAKLKGTYEAKEETVGVELLRRVERDIMLQIVDTQWKDHLYSLDHLKEGIGLRGYGQRDPLVEYKKESFAIFQDMKGRVEEEIVRYLFWLRPVENQEARPAARRATPLTLNNPSAETVPAFAATGRTRPGVPAGAQQRPARAGGDDVVKTVRREEPKVGRNDPCPCGSGKKYKKCHGAQ
jgi:preprotein translocase subunit SecA